MIDSIKFFSGPPKTFKFIIEEQAGCVIDPDKTTVAVDINRGEDIYTISLSAATLSIMEGETGRVLIRRHVTADPEVLPATFPYAENESSVNIIISEIYNANGSYTPVVTGSNDKNIVHGKYKDFSATGIAQHGWHRDLRFHRQRL